jgi:hypothetical protein
MSNQRFTADSDNRVTDSVSGVTTSALNPEHAALVVNSGNAADAMMRVMGTVRSSLSARGYTVTVTRDDFYVTED